MKKLCLVSCLLLGLFISVSTEAANQSCGRVTPTQAELAASVARPSILPPGSSGWSPYTVPSITNTDPFRLYDPLHDTGLEMMDEAEKLTRQDIKKRMRYSPLPPGMTSQQVLEAARGPFNDSVPRSGVSNSLPRVSINEADRILKNPAPRVPFSPSTTSELPSILRGPGTVVAIGALDSSGCNNSDPTGIFTAVASVVTAVALIVDMLEEGWENNTTTEPTPEPAPAPPPPPDREQRGPNRDRTGHPTDGGEENPFTGRGAPECSAWSPIYNNGGSSSGPYGITIPAIDLHQPIGQERWCGGGNGRTHYIQYF